MTQSAEKQKYSPYTVTHRVSEEHSQNREETESERTRDLLTDTQLKRHS